METISLLRRTLFFAVFALFVWKTHAEAPELSLETIFHPDRKVDFDGPDVPRTQWLPSGMLAIFEGNTWKTLDPKTGKKSAWDVPSKIEALLRTLGIADEKRLERASRSLGQSSENGRYRLIQSDAHWYWLDLERDEIRKLDQGSDKWELVQLSPDGQKIGLIHDRKLCCYDLRTQSLIQIASSEDPTVLLGKLDWVYQEEVYGRGNFRAFWFSPDGKRIAYLRLEERKVPEWTLDDATQVAQKLETERYPRSGDPLPRVSLFVASSDAETANVLIDEPDEVNEERLIVRVQWKSSDELVYQTQDRKQSWLDLNLMDLTSLKRRRLLREDTGAWQEPLSGPHWLPDGSFLWLSDRANGRRHVYRIQPNQQAKACTKGAWNVWEIDYVAGDGKFAVVTGTSRAGFRNAYRIDLQSMKEPVPLIDGGGSVQAHLNATGDFCTVEYSAAGVPKTLWLCPTDRTSKLEPLAEQNDSLESLSTETPRRLHGRFWTPWHEMKIAPPTLEWISVGQDTELPVQIFSPQHAPLDQHAAKMPVLIHTYAGPLNPAAVDRWQGTNGLWHQMLANQGIVVVVVDPRSSAGKGPGDAWPIYGRMGEQELKDVEAIVDQLSKRSWFDAKRVGIWGWSYGGFFTSYALTHSDRFACGIAGAPVTDWLNYDAIYTERYMNLPRDNPEGYKATSTVKSAGNLKQPLMIIHGGLDDNVHPTNTWQFVHAAMNAQAPITPLYFPTSRHAVLQPAQRFWMYRQMTEFLQRHLLKTP